MITTPQPTGKCETMKCQWPAKHVYFDIYSGHIDLCEDCFNEQYVPKTEVKMHCKHTITYKVWGKKNCSYKDLDSDSKIDADNKSEEYKKFGMFLCSDSCKEKK